MNDLKLFLDIILTQPPLNTYFYRRKRVNRITGTPVPTAVQVGKEELKIIKRTMPPRWKFTAAYLLSAAANSSRSH